MILFDIIFDLNFSANLDLPRLREAPKEHDYNVQVFDFFDVDPTKFRFSERPSTTIIPIRGIPNGKNKILSREAFIYNLIINPSEYKKYIYGAGILRILTGHKKGDAELRYDKHPNFDSDSSKYSYYECVYHNKKLLCTRDFITSIYTGRVFIHDDDPNYKYENYADLSMFNVIMFQRE